MTVAVIRVQADEERHVHVCCHRCGVEYRKALRLPAEMWMHEAEAIHLVQARAAMDNFGWNLQSTGELVCGSCARGLTTHWVPAATRLASLISEVKVIRKALEARQ